MKTKNRLLQIKNIIFLAVILLAGCLLYPENVKAAGVSSYLSSTSSYDLNGDGKKDSVWMVSPSFQNSYSGKLYINGKLMYRFPAYDYSDWCGFKVITLKNNKRFLLLAQEGDNPGISDNILVQYTRNKKLKKIFDFRSATKKFGGASLISQVYGTRGVYVSGNTLYVRYEKMLWTTGGVTLEFKFKYKNGTLVKASNTGKVLGSGELTTSTSIQTYKTAGSSKKAVLIPGNTNVRVIKYYLKGGSMWIQLKDTWNRSGWIKCLTRNTGTGRSPLFINGWYAG